MRLHSGRPVGGPSCRAFVRHLLRSEMNNIQHTHRRLVGYPRRRPLRAVELLESALKRGGRRDFADRSFIRPFEHLLQACNEEADLSVFGERALRIDVLRCLRNVLYFDQIEEDCPAVL